MIMLEKVPLLTIIAIVLAKGKYAVQPTAVIFPRGYNASLDPEASFTFQCNTTGAGDVQWFIDGLPSTRREIRNRGISESDVDGATGSLRRSLTIMRNITNRMTTILCTANTFSSPGIINSSVSSVQVLFKIQGLLDAPSNLMLSEADNRQHTRRLSWNEPFSLDITDVDPDISHYEVCYNLVDANKSQCVRVNQTEFSFPYVNVPLLFTVSAVNVVGEGNSSSVPHEATNCNSSKDLLINNIQSRVSFLGLSGMNPMAVFLFQQPLNDSARTCFFVYKIESYPLSVAKTTDHGLQIPLIVNLLQNSIQLSLTVDTELTVNEEYHAIIGAVDANGEASYNNGTIKFDTYDVQSINGTVLAGGVELTCIFAEGSQAQSCILTVCRMASGNEESCWNITINRTESTKGQEVSDLQPGLYTIREVAEVEKNGQLTIHRKQNVLELRITEPPPSTTIPGSLSLINTVLISIGSIAAVAVLLGFVIIIVVICTKKKYGRISPRPHT